MIATDDYREAVYDTLNGNITGSVLSAVPQGTPYPYTVLGPTTSVPDDDLTSEGSDETLTLFPWDRSNSRVRLVTIMREIDALLHNQTLTKDGRTFYVSRDIAETFTEQAADGATLQRGRLVYRAKTYE